MSEMLPSWDGETAFEISHHLTCDEMEELCSVMVTVDRVDLVPHMLSSHEYFDEECDKHYVKPS